jgi:putative aldouronate transport system permease protein
VEPIFFLADNKWFRVAMVGMDVWKNFGFGTVVYLAAITGIDPTLYEAAMADGAGYLRRAWHITIPGMLPIIVLVTILNLSNLLNAGFDQIFNMYNPVVYKTGDIIDTFVYRIGIVDARYSLATAVGLFKSAISAVLVSTSYYVSYRFANYRIF